jgi:tetratricopeptide (TPR) repeat protein
MPTASTAARAELEIDGASRGRPNDANHSVAALRFDAFLSYSHQSDHDLAATLQHEVQRVGKRWWQRRRLRVFRDQTSLPLTPALWSSVERSLEESRYLILLASTHAARSEWVAKEVGWWIANRSSDTLLVALSEGDLHWDPRRGGFDPALTTALPPSLHARFAEEPKFLDLRWMRETEAGSARTAQFVDAAAEISAAIQQVAKDELVGEDLRAQRRALRLAWSSAATLLVLLGAAVWLFFESRQQTERANRRFEDVRQISNQFLTEFHESIADLPGTTTAREKLVRTALKYLDNLRADAAADWTLLVEIAHGYERQGHFLGDPYFASLGQTDASLAAYRQSLAIYDSLPPPLQESPEILRRSAWVRSSIGVLLAMQGKRAEAEPYFEAAMRGMNQAITLTGGAPDAQDRQNLGLLYHRHGDVFLHDGDRAGARREFTAALDITKALLAENPEDPLAARYHAQVLGKLAVIEFADDPPRALTLFEEEKHLLTPLVEREPLNVSISSDLALTLFSMAVLKSAHLDDPRGAVPLFDEALEIRKRIVSTDPRNGNAYRDLVADARFAAQFFYETGASEKAGELFGLALSGGEERLALAPNDTVAAQDLAQTCASIGDLAVKEGDSATAAKLYARIEELGGDGSGWSSGGRRLLAHGLRGSALASIAGSGEGTNAVSSLDRAEALLRQLLQETPDDAATKKELAFVMDARAEVELASADRSSSFRTRAQATRRACDHHRASLDLLRSVAATDPTLVNAKSVDALASMIQSCDKLAASYEDVPESRPRRR